MNARVSRLVATGAAVIILTFGGAGAAAAYVPNPEPYPSIVASFAPAAPAEPDDRNLAVTGGNSNAAGVFAVAALVGGLGLFALGRIKKWSQR